MVWVGNTKKRGVGKREIGRGDSQCFFSTEGVSTTQVSIYPLTHTFTCASDFFIKCQPAHREFSQMMQQPSGTVSFPMKPRNADQRGQGLNY